MWLALEFGATWWQYDRVLSTAHVRSTTRWPTLTTDFVTNESWTPLLICKDYRIIPIISRSWSVDDIMTDIAIRDLSTISRPISTISRPISTISRPVNNIATDRRYRDRYQRYRDPISTISRPISTISRPVDDITTDIDDIATNID